LAQHFLQRTAADAGKTSAAFTDEALAALTRYTWPGNVRELQNVVERAVLLARGPQIGLEDLPSQIAAGQPVSVAGVPDQPLKNALQAPERAIILSVLERHNWNRNATAEALGINRTTLYKKMKRLGLLDAPRASRPQPH
jgi:DNA-binding NtrC family response regulator